MFPAHSCFSPPTPQFLKSPVVPTYVRKTTLVTAPQGAGTFRLSVAIKMPQIVSRVTSCTAPPHANRKQDYGAEGRAPHRPRPQEAGGSLSHRGEAGR